MNKKEILEAINKLLEQYEIPNVIGLELEDYNFRVNSDGWKKITVDEKEYLENPEADIWEILDGAARGEQLFTFNAAKRETKKAGKRIPTDEEFSKLAKNKEDIKKMTKKQLLEEFTEGLEILFLKRGRGSKIYSSDLDRTIKFFTQAINRVEKAEMVRVSNKVKDWRRGMSMLGKEVDTFNKAHEQILKVLQDKSLTDN